jgi:hypothetical protein
VDLDAGLGGSWWILTWILVDLDVDLGGSWRILTILDNLLRPAEN